MLGDFLKPVIGILLFVLLAHSAMASDSAYMENHCQVKKGTCEYYQCADKVHTCYQDGYYQKFAKPYCETFLNETIHKVSPQGKKWLKDVAQCLQNKLAYYTKKSDPCWFVEEMAIKTHAECYVEAGGCELDVRDLLPVVNTFWKEFSDSRIFWQGIDYVVACAKRY